jgi:hypothetical protein
MADSVKHKMLSLGSDSTGILTKPRAIETSVPGMFAGGTDRMAAIDAERFLEAQR